MGIEDYNFLKSTLEEVATLRENRKKNRRDLKGLKKSLADLEQKLPILRDNLEGVTSREGNMPPINELEIKIMDLQGILETAEEERDRLIARHSETEKKVKDSEDSPLSPQGFLLLLVLAICVFVLTGIMGANPKFECENGESVNYFWLDDGEEHCLDGTDERPTAADTQRAESVNTFACFLCFLALIIVWVFDEALKSKDRNDVQLINSQLDRQKDNTRTSRISIGKLEEQLSTRRSLKNDVKELPILIEECLKNIENAEMDIQRTIEEIRNISKMIEEKMTSISHLIPYSEFVPE